MGQNGSKVGAGVAIGIGAGAVIAGPVGALIGETVVGLIVGEAVAVAAVTGGTVAAVTGGTVGGITGGIIAAEEEEKEARRREQTRREARRNAEIIRAMPIKRRGDNKEYYCPISGELMEDPVMSIHGHCYERKVIEKVIRNTGRCPYTRKPLKMTELASRPELKRR